MKPVPPKPTRKRRPIVVDRDIAAMAHVIALAERTTVAKVCRPHILRPLRKRFDSLPEPFKQLTPGADGRRPTTA